MKRKRGRIPIQITDGRLPCSGCKELKTVDQFYSGVYTKTDGKRNHAVRACGYSSSCKACQRKYFRDHPERQAKQSAQSIAWQRSHPVEWHVIQVRYWAKCKLKRIAQRLKERCAPPLQDMVVPTDAELVIMLERGEL